MKKQKYWFIDVANYAHLITADTREQANETYKHMHGSIDDVVAYPVADCQYCNRPHRVPFADFGYPSNVPICKGEQCEAKHAHNMALRRQCPDTQILFTPNPLRK